MAIGAAIRAQERNASALGHSPVTEGATPPIEACQPRDAQSRLALLRRKPETARGSSVLAGKSVFSRPVPFHFNLSTAVLPDRNARESVPTVIVCDAGSLSELCFGSVRATISGHCHQGRGSFIRAVQCFLFASVVAWIRREDLGDARQRGEIGEPLVPDTRLAS